MWIIRTGGCVTTVIARSRATKQSLKYIEKQQIATPPLVSRDNKHIIMTQPPSRASNVVIRDPVISIVGLSMYLTEEGMVPATSAGQALKRACSVVKKTGGLFRQNSSETDRDVRREWAKRLSLLC